MTSGKTTTADYFIKNIRGAKRLSLAGAVKDLVYNLSTMHSLDLLEKYIEPYYPLTVSKTDKFLQILHATREIPSDYGKERKRLQYLGTDGGRKLIDKNIWTTIALNKVKDDINYIIDDCRFVNEYEILTNNEWVPVYLHVSKQIQIDRITKLYGEFDPKILEHQSEIDINNIHVPVESIFSADVPLEEMLNDIKEFIWKKQSLQMSMGSY